MKIRVLAISLASIAVLFACTITVHYLSEGSMFSPVAISIGDSRLSTIGEFGTSYYQFTTGPLGGGNYTIALTNTHSDLSWDFWTSSYGHLVNCDNFVFPGPNDEIDVVAATASTTYYLTVDEWDGVDGTFILTVTGPF
jgi:hypothetical protein